MTNSILSTREWLETDGLGGFASGTSTGIRTRRYHALLLAATTPPTGRVVLVNGFDAWIDTPDGRFFLTSQCYSPDVIGGDGSQRIESFTTEPWPTWEYLAEDGTQVQHEVFIRKGSPFTAVSWRLKSHTREVKLCVRPFLSGRDYHQLHHENGAFRFEPEIRGEQLIWRPYDGVPEIVSLSNGVYGHDPVWYRNFHYCTEAARGLDCEEDLVSPGIYTWDLSAGEAVWILSSGTLPNGTADISCTKRIALARNHELERRKQFPSRMHASADQYIVDRVTAGRPQERGKTIIAGYPWFTDWGRDTFIALRGLCLAGGRHEEARQILLSWAGNVSEGMLPNRFPDNGESPEYNSVDASLWYVVAVHEYLQATKSKRGKNRRTEKETLLAAVNAIIEGYAAGTRYGIRMDEDGLLAAGVPGVQLTWMDAKVGDWVVTPRIGKPVEVQALWLNALWIASQHTGKWAAALAKGHESFRNRFWNAQRRCLYDVVDVNHQAGLNDDLMRPNQIFAVGGLPFPLLEGECGRSVAAAVEKHLLTPLGLRTLGPEEPGYAAHYRGGVWERDGAYHQGTVWPWLLGPFVEAWLRVEGDTPENRKKARHRFIEPILPHLEDAGIGHIAEIADAKAPHTPCGCPFQAWSLGELMRLDQIVLAEGASKDALEGKEPAQQPAAG